MSDLVRGGHARITVEGDPYVGYVGTIVSIEPGPHERIVIAFYYRGELKALAYLPDQVEYVAPQDVPEPETGVIL